MTHPQLVICESRSWWVPVMRRLCTLQSFEVTEVRSTTQALQFLSSLPLSQRQMGAMMIAFSVDELRPIIRLANRAKQLRLGLMLGHPPDRLYSNRIQLMSAGFDQLVWSPIDLGATQRLLDRLKRRATLSQHLSQRHTTPAEQIRDRLPWKRYESRGSDL